MPKRLSLLNQLLTRPNGRNDDVQLSCQTISVGQSSGASGNRRNRAPGGGAALVDVDETLALATVVGAKSARPSQDFFPLTVDYIEKSYAAGRIPGGFFRREGRPSEGETLISRLIDRPLRPLFPE